MATNTQSDADGVHDGDAQCYAPGDSSFLLRSNETEMTQHLEDRDISPTPSLEIEIINLRPHKITLLHTCTILVTMIGSSGIFIVPATLVQYSGSVGVTLIVMFITGFINYALSKCFSEVAILLPKAGGPYFFIMQVFGRFPAFLFMWGMLLLIVCPVWALLAYTAALYIIQPIFPDCSPPTAAIKLLAICILIMVVLVNCLYMKYVSKMQTILSSSKLIAIGIVIVGGTIRLAQGETENFHDIFEHSHLDAGKIALSGLAGMFFYGGWQIITFLMEEMENPVKTLPRALNLSFCATITMYMLVMAAYFTLLSPIELLHSDAVALLFMERLYLPLTPVMSILVTASSVGALNACVLGHSRFLSAVASQGHMPRILSMVSATYFMPWPAIIVLSLLSVIFIVMGTVEQLIQSVSLFACTMAVAVLSCLLVLKWKRPPAPDSIRVSTALAISQFLLSLLILLMSIYQKPGPMGSCIAMVSFAFPIYIVCVMWKKPKAVDRFSEDVMHFLQKLLIVKAP